MIGSDIARMARAALFTEIIEKYSCLYSGKLRVSSLASRPPQGMEIAGKSNRARPSRIDPRGRRGESNAAYFPQFCTGCDIFTTTSRGRIGYVECAHVGVSSQPGPAVRGPFLSNERVHRRRRCRTSPVRGQRSPCRRSPVEDSYPDAAHSESGGLALRCAPRGSTRASRLGRRFLTSVAAVP